MPELKKSVSQKLRMAGRDYTRRGWYFVTLSADYHRHLFGDVVGGRSPEMACNELGRLVEREWGKILSERQPGNQPGKSTPPRVWQPNYWDVICFDEDELATREAYIRANPLRWALRHVPRGVIKKSRYLGNSALLRAAPKRALRLSRKATEGDVERHRAEALAEGAVVVSTFFSPGERSVLDRLLAADEARMIWVLPMGMPKSVPTKWAGALAAGRALWVSAFPDDMTDASRETCQLCNQWAERLEQGETR